MIKNLKKVKNNKFKINDIYINDNKPETKNSEAPREITLCKCVHIDEDNDYVDFLDFQILEGKSKFGEWLYDKTNDFKIYNFYHVPRKKYPEYYL